VYQGLNQDNGKLIAVKQFNLKDEGISESTVLEIKREIELMQNLDHSNIVNYYGADLKDGVFSIFMELVPGGSLQSLVSKHGALTERVSAIYVKQILMGLDFLHDRNIVHRDIKGANVLITDNGECKLADFGCSKQVSGED
jgi:serine/threonine protein kinase